MRRARGRALLLLAIAMPAGAAWPQSTPPAQGRDGGVPRGAPLNTIDEVFRALQACWRPPPLAEARPGMEITFQLSFKRDGNILGKPRITFQTRDATPDQADAYRLALAEALARCLPLTFSESLGHAIAGRPFNMRLIDSRQQKRI